MKFNKDDSQMFKAEMNNLIDHYDDLFTLVNGRLQNNSYVTSINTKISYLEIRRNNFTKAYADTFSLNKSEIEAHSENNSNELSEITIKIKKLLDSIKVSKPNGETTNNFVFGMTGLYDKNMTDVDMFISNRFAEPYLKELFNQEVIDGLKEYELTDEQIEELKNNILTLDSAKDAEFICKFLEGDYENMANIDAELLGEDGYLFVLEFLMMDLQNMDNTDNEKIISFFNSLLMSQDGPYYISNQFYILAGLQEQARNNVFLVNSLFDDLYENESEINEKEFLSNKKVLYHHSAKRTEISTLISALLFSGKENSTTFDSIPNEDGSPYNEFRGIRIDKISFENTDSAPTFVEPSENEEETPNGVDYKAFTIEFSKGVKPASIKDGKPSYLDSGGPIVLDKEFSIMKMSKIETKHLPGNDETKMDQYNQSRKKIKDDYNNSIIDSSLSIAAGIAMVTTGPFSVGLASLTSIAQFAKDVPDEDIPSYSKYKKEIIDFTNNIESLESKKRDNKVKIVDLDEKQKTDLKQNRVNGTVKIIEAMISMVSGTVGYKDKMRNQTLEDILNATDNGRTVMEYHKGKDKKSFTISDAFSDAHTQDMFSYIKNHGFNELVSLLNKTGSDDQKISDLQEEVIAEFISPNNNSNFTLDDIRIFFEKYNDKGCDFYKLNPTELEIYAFILIVMADKQEGKVIKFKHIVSNYKGGVKDEEK